MSTEEYIRHREIREVMTAFHIIAPALRGTEDWSDFAAHINSELSRLRARQRVGGSLCST